MNYSMPASLSFSKSRSLLRFMSVELVMPSNYLVFCHPLLLTSVFPSIRVFSSESALRIRRLKYWSFSISPSNEYSGLISFRMGWFDLLAVQGTLKNLQRHSLKASILRHLAFFMVQICIHIWLLEKPVLTIQNFESKVMSLLFNMLSRFVIAFLPRSKHLLISRLQSPSVVILETKKIKSVTVSTFPPIYFPWHLNLVSNTILLTLCRRRGEDCYCLDPYHIPLMI